MTAAQWLTEEDSDGDEMRLRERNQVCVHVVGRNETSAVTSHRV